MLLHMGRQRQNADVGIMGTLPAEGRETERERELVIVCVLVRDDSRV